MASGSDEAFEIGEPVLQAMAAKIYRIGTEPGLGSIVKTVNQLLAGAHIVLAAEAMAFGTRAGADPEVLFEVISNSAGSSWMFNNRVPHMLKGDFTPLSAVNIFVKDLGIVLDVAHELTHLPQARGPLSHGRAQDQQRARPGAPRPEDGQAPHHRRDRRGPARRRHGHRLRALRPALRGLHGRGGRRAAGAQRRAHAAARRRGASRSTSGSAPSRTP